MKVPQSQQKREKVAEKITVFSFLSQLDNWIRNKSGKISAPLDIETTLVLVKG